MRAFKTTHLRILISALTMFFLAALPGIAGISGNFTIDSSLSPSSKNYKNFSSAISDLISGMRSDGGAANGPGLSGPAVFKVANGVYSEQLHITQIGGASVSNTVTFQSASGDSTKVILSWPSSAISTNNYTLMLDTASYITFQNMTIERTGINNYSNVVSIRGNAAWNSFYNDIIIGANNQTTGTANAVIISNGNDSGTAFIHNYILYGSYGFAMQGLSTTLPGKNLDIEDNLIDSFYYIGLYVNEQNTPVINKNILLSSSYYQNSYGLDIENCINGLQITKNKITLTDGYLGIYLYSDLCTVSSPGLIANNMVSIGGTYTSLYGVLSYNTAFLNLYDNNFLLNTTNNGYVYYHYKYTTTDTFNNIVGNNFINKGGGSISNIYTSILGNTGINRMNYNNEYTSGAVFASFLSVNYSNLSGWQSGTLLDSNSLSVDPLYLSNSDLHVSSPLINNKNIPLAGVTDDFDGQPRSTTTPDIGADEFTPFINDAGVTSIDSPTTGFCTASKDIYVTIENVGTSALTSANIGWAVNGAAQAAIAWTGSVAPGNSLSGIKIGTYSFSAGLPYSFTAYTTGPNGATDSNASNDTSKRIIETALTGIYTIGGASPDYTSFSAAAHDLNSRGVCGPVTFNVADGFYQGQMEIDSIGGASATNTITFQSLSGDSTKAILTFPSQLNQINGYTVYLNGAKYITFKNLTITSSGDNAYSNIISLNNNANYNNFLNCRLIGVSNATSGNQSIVYTLNGDNSFNVFRNNLIRNGYYGVFIEGSGKGQNSTGNIIDGNTFDSSASYSVYCYYENNLHVTRNTMNYSTMFVYCDSSLTIEKNKIIVTNGGTYGMLIELCTASLTNQAHIDNNFVTLSTGNYGIYFYQNKYFDIVYNNLLLTNGAYPLYYITPGTNIDSNTVLNNNFVNTGTGEAIYIQNFNTLRCNYNNLYTSGANLGNFKGALEATLSDWQAASSMDSNSISIDPIYNSNTDLHVNAAGLDGAATPIAYITTDIDGQTRNATTPDIGADEFTPVGDDAGAFSVDSPVLGYCPGVRNVYISVKDFGTNILASATINWTINGAAQPGYAWTGSLTQGTTASVNVGTYSFTSGNTFIIKAWTTLPNGNPDGNNSNDTFISNSLINGISGIYTIGGSSPDYNSFNAALTDIKSRGVCGSVVFNVRDGSYNEHLLFGTIPNASPTNTVTFQSQSGDNKKVVLYWPAGNNINNYLISLSNTNWITFKNMTLARTTGGNYSTVVTFAGASQHVSFINNIMHGAAASTNSYIIYSAGKRDTSITVSNNYMYDGTYGVYLSGTAVNMSNNLTISNNKIDSMYTGGIFVSYQLAVNISQNTISNIFTNATAYGIYIQYCDSTAQILGNKIDVPLTNANNTYGLYFANNTGSAAGRALIANNFISAGSGSSAGAAIYLANNKYSNIYFNNLLQTSSSGTAYSIYNNSRVNNDDSLQLINNNIVNNGGGYAIYIRRAAALNISDYNNLYTTGSDLGRWVNTTTADLSAWQKTSGKDASSLSLDPVYFSNDDLHDKAKGIRHAGTPIIGITVDFDGQLRNALTPDIGADEVVPTPDDVEPYSFLNPVNNTCGDSATQISFVIANAGSASQKIIPYTVIISGSASATIHDTIKTTLLSGGYDTITLKTTLNTFSGGTYNFKIYTNLFNDSNRSNDTLTTNIAIFRKSQEPAGYSGANCNSGTVKLVAVPKNLLDQINWYSTSIGGSSLHTGDTFSTPVISATTTYYAQAGTTCPSARVPVTAYIGAAGATYTKDKLFNGQFNAGTSANPDAICIGNEAAYDISTIFQDSSYNKTWNISGLSFSTTGGKPNTDTTFRYPTSSKDALFTFTPKSSDGDSTFVVSLKVKDLTHGCDTVITRYVYVNPLPKANFGTQGGCAKTAMNFYDSSKTGKSAVSYSWSFGDGSTSSSPNPSNTYSKSGTYTVKLIINLSSGCSDSISKQVTVSPLPVVNFSSKSVCGSQVAFTDSSLVAGGSIVARTWYFGDGHTDTSANSLHTFPNIGTYNVKLVATSSMGCIDSVTKQVKVNNSLKAGFSTTEVCSGDSSRFTDSTVSTSKITSWLWHFGDGDSSSVQNPAHLFSTYGLYHVKLKVTSLAGCIDTTSANVRVDTKPDAAFGIGKITCQSSVVNFYDSSITNGATVTYLWDFGNGDTSISKNPAVIYTKAGSYQVHLTVTTIGKCFDSVSKTIVISPAPIANFGAENICLGSPVQFSDSSTIASGAISSYSWKFGNGDTSVSQSPVNTYAASGSYSVSLMVTSNAGCEGSITRNVTINPLPISLFTDSITNTTVKFFPKDTAYSSYLWLFGDNDSSTAKKPVHIYTNYKIYTVKLTVTDKNGCSDTSSASINLIMTEAGRINYVPANISISPNPFNQIVNIEYNLISASNVTSGIYDMTGREIVHLSDGMQNEGSHNYLFDANKYSAGAGVYFLRMVINGNVINEKIVRIR